jgi:MFS family permease
MLTLTRSPFLAGLIGFTSFAPSIIFYLPAGLFMDRWNARRVMLACEAARGVVIVAVLGSLLADDCTVYVLLTASFIEGTLAVFYSLGEPKFIKENVLGSQLATAFSVGEGRTYLAALLGKPFGGLLFSLGQAVPFLADAASFVISVTALSLTKPAPIRTDGPSGSPVRVRDLAGGVTAVSRDSYLRMSIIIGGVASGLANGSFFVFIDGASADRLPAWVIGLGFFGSGLGGVLGSLLSHRLFARFGFLVMLLTQWAITISVAALAIVPGVLSFAVVQMVISLAGVAANVCLMTYIFERVPETHVSRVLSVDMLISFAGIAAGALIGGALFGAIGGRASYTLLAGVCLLTSITATGTGAMRSRQGQMP